MRTGTAEVKTYTFTEQELQRIVDLLNAYTRVADCKGMTVESRVQNHRCACALRNALDVIGIELEHDIARDTYKLAN